MNRKTLEKIIIYILLFIGGYMSASLWSKEGMGINQECYNNEDCDGDLICDDEVCVEEGNGNDGRENIAHGNLARFLSYSL